MFLSEGPKSCRCWKYVPFSIVETALGNSPRLGDLRLNRHIRLYSELSQQQRFAIELACAEVFVRAESFKE